MSSDENKKIKKSRSIYFRPVSVCPYICWCAPKCVSYEHSAPLEKSFQPGRAVWVYWVFFCTQSHGRFGQYNANSYTSSGYILFVEQWSHLANI